MHRKGEEVKQQAWLAGDEVACMFTHLWLSATNLVCGEQ